ncbi:MAG: xanthine dehydrogenase family protein molybdopterin-binding subunit [Actinomycetota bacterium]
MSDEIRTSKLDELRVVHQPLARHDAAEKIAGSTRFAGDLAYAGMLHARLVRSVVPSARLTRRDVTRAALVPGVVAVLLGEDVPHNEISVDVPGQTIAVGALKARMQILATERVRFHGEPIALVIAEHEDALAEACEAVEVEYDELPVISEPADALAEDAFKIHEGGNLLAEWRIDRGDVDAAFASADVVIEGAYTTQFVDHAYLEPEAGVGWYDDDGVMNLRVATQVVEHYRDVAKILGVPDSKVRVIAPYVGGGFGGKEDMTVEPYLALAVAHTRRPVRMQWTRNESLLARAKRHRNHMTYRTAATNDGTILAQDIEIVSDAGAYAYLSALVLLYSSVHACGPYRLDHARIRATTAYTNNPPTSAFRGFGGMQVVLGYESQIDELARRLRLDPGEVRKRNALRRGDRLPVGQEIITEVQLAETIDAVRERAGEKPAPSGPRKAVGRAIASNMQSYGRLVWLNDSAAAWIGFQMDGSLTVRCGVPDIGGGQASSLAQIASEILAVDMDRITVHFGDSALNPLAGTTTATRQLLMSGNATYEAAVMLRDQLLGAVAASTRDPVESLAMTPEGIAGPGGITAVTAALQICRRGNVPVEALGTFFGPKGKEVTRDLDGERLFPDFTFGTHLADVEVDLDTGEVKVLRYLAAHDVGRAINPLSVEGQIAGAAVQGIGQALLEEIVMQDGVNLTGGFFQYLIPTAMDVPDIEAIVLESGEGLGPFGARGIGEPPIGPPLAAISSAIADAVGARPTTLPITPERVLECVERGARSTP